MCGNKDYNYCINFCPEEKYFLCPELQVLRYKQGNKRTVLTLGGYVILLITIISLIIFL